MDDMTDRGLLGGPGRRGKFLPFDDDLYHQGESVSFCLLPAGVTEVFTVLARYGGIKSFSFCFAGFSISHVSMYECKIW